MRETKRVSDVVTGEAVALDLRIAQLPARASAALIDLLIMGAGYLLLGLIGGFTLSGVVDEALSAALYVLLVVGVFLGYPVIMETLTRGRTVGKMALGIRVIRADGGPITFRHALVRGLVGLVLERPGFALAGFGPALAVYVSTLSKNARRIGDMAAGTMVLQERVNAQPSWIPWMPAPLTVWANTLDLTRFDDGLALQVRQFLGRAGQLYPAAREQLGHLLAAEVRQRTTPAPPPGTPGWAYLSAVLAERRYREESRAAAAIGRPAPPRAIWPPPWPPTPFPYAGGPSVPYPYGPATPYAGGPIPYAGGPVPYGAGPVRYGAVPVPYAGGPVPYGGGPLPYGSAPVAYGSRPDASYVGTPAPYPAGPALPYPGGPAGPYPAATAGPLPGQQGVVYPGPTAPGGPAVPQPAGPAFPDTDETAAPPGVPQPAGPALPDTGATAAPPVVPQPAGPALPDTDGTAAPPGGTPAVPQPAGPALPDTGATAAPADGAPAGPHPGPADGVPVGAPGPAAHHPGTLPVPTAAGPPGAAAGPAGSSPPPLPGTLPVPDLPAPPNGAPPAPAGLPAEPQPGPDGPPPPLAGTPGSGGPAEPALQPSAPGPADAPNATEPTGTGDGRAGDGAAPP